MSAGALHLLFEKSEVSLRNDMQRADECEWPIFGRPLPDIFKTWPNFTGVDELILCQHHVGTDLNPMRKSFVLPVMLPDRLVIFERL